MIIIIKSDCPLCFQKLYIYFYEGLGSNLMLCKDGDVKFCSVSYHYYRYKCWLGLALKSFIEFSFSLQEPVIHMSNSKLATNSITKVELCTRTWIQNGMRSLPFLLRMCLSQCLWNAMIMTEEFQTIEWVQQK